MALDRATIERIQSEFPAFASLLSIPDVAGILIRAVEEGWDVGKLQANLYATKWWKQNSESQRNAAILQRTDPASYNRQVDVIRANILSQANRLGAGLSTAEILFLSRRAFNEGWSTEEITRQIVTVGRRRGFGVGEIRKTSEDIIALSKAYGINVSKRWADNYATRIAYGEKNMDAMQSYFHETALARYSDNLLVKRGLQAGHTLADIMEPTLSLVAHELELGAGAQWDLTAGLAAKVINYKDPDTGQIRPMTDSEAMQLARSDRRWRDTNGAKSLATQATNAIARFMGSKT